MLVLLVSSIFSFELTGQGTGGQNVFPVLGLSDNARTTAYGGQQIAMTEADIQMIGNNPALLNENLHQHFNFSTLFLPAGINVQHLAYAHSFDRFTSALQLQFVNYGSFKQTDIEGNELGNFTGNDLVFSYSSAYQLHKWTFGGTAKFIHSSLEAYKANAIAADLGIVWHDEKSNFSFGAAVNNIGTTLKSFNGTEEIEDLPFDVQLGLSKRLKHVPFRFSLNMHDLHRWNIRYDDPNEAETSIFGEEEQDKNYFADELFRHFLFAGEFYLGKPLRIQIAYNHKIRQEMRLDNRAGLAGFSFGVGIITKKFTFNYGIGVNSLAGSAHHLGFSTSVQAWKSKRKKKRVSKGEVG